MADKNPTGKQREWQSARSRLIDAVQRLGFPAELGYVVAQNLGSPKAIANGHFPRLSGPHFPASQGHIKRPV